MATRSRNISYHQTPQFLNLPTTNQISGIGGGGSGGGGGFELNESDIWNMMNNDDHEAEKSSVPRKLGSSRKPMKPHQQRKVMSTSSGKSLPVNVPDWSKILRDEYKHHGFDDDDDDDGGGGGGGGGDEWLPPHEYLARTRVASCSVHEGIGRTLKGRDLSRVRNAIWKQTGFGED